MTVEKLKQYSFLKKEITGLEDKIANVNSYSGVNYEKIGVRGGGNKSDLVVAAVEKKDKLEIILRDRLQKAKDLLTEIEEWLDSIDDSYIRQCIDYHYIRGYSWQSTSNKLTGAMVDGAVLSNMVTRFLKKSENLEVDENDENNMI